MLKLSRKSENFLSENDGHLTALVKGNTFEVICKLPLQANPTTCMRRSGKIPGYISEVSMVSLIMCN